jgi:hypothetical protein
MKKKSSKTRKRTKLFRFTTLPFLLDILHNKHLTLVDPENWEDRNDAYYLDQFKRRLGLKTVLALCFSTQSETHHHWKIFSGTSAGVRLRFNKKRLLACFRDLPGVSCGDVRYRTIKHLRKHVPAAKDLPFLKRRSYKDEREFRIVYKDKRRLLSAKHFRIDLTSLERITLSPWLPKSVAESVKSVLKKTMSSLKISVFRSTLIENERWKAFAE